MSVRGILVVCFIAAWAQECWAVSGSSMALRSNGGSVGGAWRLDDSGYVGTYFNLAEPGSVTVTVDAQGQSAGTAERMNVVIGDAKFGWDVTNSAATYQHTFDLPAGTHFLRTEYANGPNSSALVVNSVDVAGATLLNSNTSANALAAANTYIATSRQGEATLQLPAAWSGADVQIKLRTHAFNFGTAVPNSFTDTLLVANPSPGSDAARFQQALRDNRLSLLTPENGGKWDANEGTRDVLTAAAVNPNGGPNIPYMDRISDYAAANGMRYRAHNVIWGPNGNGSNNQQPGWAYNMLQNPTAIDAVTGQPNSVALRDEISERIDYYVQDRAQRFTEVDVYNESYHTGSNYTQTPQTYWDVYGVDGVASIYKEVNDAIAAAGSDAKAFVNEYSVLQNQGGDYYANWYARHIEAIQSAGQAQFGENVVGGIGIQYYNGGQAGSHSAARVYADFQNLAVQDLPITLTEWGVTGGTESFAASVLSETVTLAFGMPGVTGMTHWNLRSTPGAFAPVGSLYNNDWSLRQTGVAWQQLMAQWDTDLTTTVAADGTVDFTGFFGDYEVTLGDQTYALSLMKGTDQYELTIPAPLAGDFDFNGMVDAADLAVWSTNFGLASGATHAQGDADGNGAIDGADFAIWQRQFDSGLPAFADAAAVPEPATAFLTLTAIASFSRRSMTGVRPGARLCRHDRSPA